MTVRQILLLPFAKYCDCGHEQSLLICCFKNGGIHQGQEKLINTLLNNATSRTAIV
jgi:hypothetical protein